MESRLAPPSNPASLPFRIDSEMDSKTRQDLKKKLVAEQDSVEKLKDALSRFQDEIEGNNFGLDAKNKDDKKKIDDARKILSAKLKEYMDTRDDDFKNLKELDKHLVNIADYKPGSS